MRSMIWIAIRCILSTHSDKRYMLGYIHELKPMPGRFRDYIANRKASYQSIHTTVYALKVRLSSRFETKRKKCTKSQNTGSLLTVIKERKEFAIGMNWIKELMELQNQSGDVIDSVKESYLAE